MLLFVTLACEVDYQNVAQERILDSYAYVDAGAVNVGESQTFTLPLFSQADGDIRIFAIQLEDLTLPEGQTESAFTVDSGSWEQAGCDRDGDGVGDCLDLTGYDPDSDSDTWPLSAVFSPQVEGYYEGIATVWSNDSVTEEKSALPSDPEGQEYGIWRVQLRGLSRYACGRLYPTYHDFGQRPANGDFSTTFQIDNCGVVPVTVTQIVMIDSPNMTSLTQTPLYVLPGNHESITVGWHVAANDEFGEPVAAAGKVAFEANSVDLSAMSATLIGNNCRASSDASFDADGDGFAYCSGDCNDNDDEINPSAQEEAGDLADNDCDGAVDEAENPIDSDDDGDGCSETGADCGARDCNDANPLVSPFAVEIRNGVDDDCNGLIDDGTDGYDDDGDGVIELSGDCDDANPLYFPGASENPTDNVDNDCDGVVDEGGPLVDDDADGWPDIADDLAMNDCDDKDPWVYVGAREYCDGYDNDCDRLVDEGNADDAGGLDAEGAACAFIPSRETEVGEVDGSASKGCDSGGALPNLVSAGLAMLLPLVRRKARD